MVFYFCFRNIDSLSSRVLLKRPGGWSIREENKVGCGEDGRGTVFYFFLSVVCSRFEGGLMH